ncbi:hypothetical protein ACKI1H_26920 [Pseudomonas sp. YH-1]|uniref:hypothetical protein n=1 Tax=Pseudomonas sp. YH-1 TaxID=3384787 RepID=UPI003F80B8D1
MSSEQTTLEKIQSITAIASSIAIPIVLAIAGYVVQRQIADDGLKKDYVVMAMEILREKGSSQDEALRSWALEVVTAYSPIKLSAEAKTGFRNWAIPPLPAEARQAPPPDFCVPNCVEGLRRLQEEERRILGSLGKDEP